MKFISKGDYTITRFQQCPRCSNTQGMEPIPEHLSEIDIEIESGQTCSRCNGSRVIDTKPVLRKSYLKKCIDAAFSGSVISVIMFVVLGPVLLTSIPSLASAITLSSLAIGIFLYILMTILAIAGSVFYLRNEYLALLQNMKQNTVEDVLAEINSDGQYEDENSIERLMESQVSDSLSKYL